MTSTSSTKTAPSSAFPTIPEWKALVSRFQTHSLPRSIWQIVNSVVPYVALWVLMAWSLSGPYWVTLLLAALAGLFLVRIFIIFHDCGHGAFFKSKRASDITGFITGMLTFTPYFHWRWEHSLHHATCGDLDRRGTGDIWTMTVEEYLAAPRWKRFAYRLARNPLILFLVAPAVLFLIYQRFPARKAGKRERMSVWWMNLAIFTMSGLLIWALGFKGWLMIQLPVTMVAGAAGVWMFYIQHQFEDVYWDHHAEWDYTAAALAGSSFYKLPRVLQWFTGNIGFHHIHHLSPRIPNYYLEACHRSHEVFQNVRKITLPDSLRSLRLRLWDEESRQLVGYDYLRKKQSGPAGQAA